MKRTIYLSRILYVLRLSRQSMNLMFHSYGPSEYIFIRNSSRGLRSDFFFLLVSFFLSILFFFFFLLFFVVFYFLVHFIWFLFHINFRVAFSTNIVFLSGTYAYIHTAQTIGYFIWFDRVIAIC